MQALSLDCVVMVTMTVVLVIGVYQFYLGHASLYIHCFLFFRFACCSNDILPSLARGDRLVTYGPCETARMEVVNCQFFLSHNTLRVDFSIGPIQD